MIDWESKTVPGSSSEPFLIYMYFCVIFPTAFENADLRYCYGTAGGHRL